MVRVFAHSICWVPLVWLIYAGIYHQLGGDPQTKPMHELGFWGLVFLLLSLSVTPLKFLFSKLNLIAYRRMLGLYAFWYLFLHLLTYIAFYLYFDFGELTNEIVERPYIAVGFAGLLLMLPLALTSTKGAQRRLKKKWKQLHQLSYLILILGFVHFVWQSKSDLNEPLAYILWGSLLFGIRVYKRYPKLFFKSPTETKGILNNED